ncbi:MAG: ATP-binding cassette domain-containing protein [Anaerolineae bacterium]|nr:ATP-binding cassette domain-containing protein [Anaerolineae bacterium]
MEKPVLRVNNLGKRFKLYHQSQDRLVEWLTLGAKRKHTDFWAVRNIQFELQRGDFLGILGHNGAGKSTLLKMLSGVLTPSEGSFEVNGRMLSLLELGTGTNESLTGRENTTNRAKIFGFSQQEVDDHISEIKEFSELGEFFEYPVSTYSSGMRARLNFSTFAFLDCDILVLDEVLAVGDIFFKQKCYQRMDELLKNDTTIILVTHSVQYVNSFCNKALVIDSGEQVYMGEKEEGVRMYGRLRHKQLRTLDTTTQKKPELADHKEKVQEKLADDNWQGKEMEWPPLEQFPEILPIRRRNLVLEQFLLQNEEGVMTTVINQGEMVTLYYTFRVVNEPVEGKIAAGVMIFDNLNRVVHGRDNYQANPHMHLPERLEPGSFVRFKQKVKMDIKEGMYIARLRALQVKEDEGLRETIFPSEQVMSFEVILPQKNALFTRFEGMADLAGSSVVQWKHGDDGDH